MRVFIAEKPSLARAIAEALPGKAHKSEGHWLCGSEDCVTWCVGHLLEQAEPHQYNADFKRWAFAHLPIIPDTWKLCPKSQTKTQLRIIRQLLARASCIVHAGDPDREGQLLVDEVLHYCGVLERKRAIRVQRCLISDLNPDAVRRALAHLEPNAAYANLSRSALGRARADWLYGINMTRAFTLQGRRVGYSGVLSVGRVQTPVLGLVVRRDRDIAAFQPKPFYQVLAHVVGIRDGVGVQDGAGVQSAASVAPLMIPQTAFTARWIPSKACEDHQDEEGRVLNRALAEHVLRQIQCKVGVIKTVERKKRSEAPPLTFNLSALQVEAGIRYGLSAQRVLDLCQSLYEQHKLITYPRSDCRYLPEGHFAQAPKVVVAITAHFTEIQNRLQHNTPGEKPFVRGVGDVAPIEAVQALLAGVETTRRSAVWNDQKIGAHHAIIPTGRASGAARLSQDELRVYELIARQYLLQFYPRYQTWETRIVVEIAGGNFEAKGLIIIDLGWRAVSRQGVPAENVLPDVKSGQRVWCQSGEVLEKMTTPPLPFTDAMLIRAMSGIARYVQTPQIRKILRETDGLGTEATRAGIVELLIRRGFLVRSGRQIRSTAAGGALIDALPTSATLPDMTAQWESQLDMIAQGSATYADFMRPLLVALRQLMEQVCGTLPVPLKALANMSAPSETASLRKSPARGQSQRRRSARPKAVKQQ
ncbi:MAG: DNA topoisomerase III [Gammaproteobacteria bacterium]